MAGLLLALLMSICMANGMTYPSHLSMEEIDSLFGPSGCIEGVLMSMPQPTLNPVMTAIPLVSQPNNKNPSVLMGSEGDGVAVNQQRQQQLQQPQSQQQQTRQQQQPTNTTSTPNTTNIYVANAKGKTPISLVNELASFNKIQHQYRLTNEQGPAHKKRFTVTLKLGDEEHSAEGASIKKAQHLAASEALQHTQYKHPAPKPSRNLRHVKSNITPTVELNALAKKRGEPTVYTFAVTPHGGASQQHNPYLPNSNHNFNHSGLFNQGYHNYGKAPGMTHPTIYYVSLRVGSREFMGEGHTAQLAQHDAASRALAQLRSLPLPEDRMQHCAAGLRENGITCPLESDLNADLKSPISLVHEIALKNDLPVNFEVESEEGPPHMRTFVTKCTVGDKVTTGEGNGKKVSKKIAAEKMLEELRKLPPSSPTFTISARQKRKANKGKKKKKTRNLIRNLIKVTFLEDDKTVEMPAGGSSGRQLVPGLLLMADAATTNGYAQNTPSKGSGMNLQTTATIAKELLKAGSSPTAEALTKSNHKNSSPHSQVVRPKGQLMNLAQLLGFQVQFSDFLKGNHGEFLSLVSLSTEPPQVCHGAGSTTDASHDQAALTALRALSEKGLDTVAPTRGNIKKEAGQDDVLHLAQQTITKTGGISLTK